jgi:hypothetical protein
VKAGQHYAKRHLSLREPYWGGTLDASGEDKEGAFAALQGFLELYETTQEADYLRWAKHACDVAISYTWCGISICHRDACAIINSKHAAGRWFSRRISISSVRRFDCTGYYRVGVHLHRDDLKRLALVMYRSCGQLIDPTAAG